MDRTRPVCGDPARFESDVARERHCRLESLLAARRQAREEGPSTAPYRVARRQARGPVLEASLDQNQVAEEGRLGAGDSERQGRTGIDADEHDGTAGHMRSELGLQRPQRAAELPLRVGGLREMKGGRPIGGGPLRRQPAGADDEQLAPSDSAPGAALILWPIPPTVEHEDQRARPGRAARHGYGDRTVPGYGQLDEICCRSQGRQHRARWRGNDDRRRARRRSRHRSPSRGSLVTAPAPHAAAPRHDRQDRQDCRLAASTFHREQSLAATALTANREASQPQPWPRTKTTAARDDPRPAATRAETPCHRALRELLSPRRRPRPPEERRAGRPATAPPVGPR